MTTLSSWNEAYDFGRAKGMTEDEAAAYADAHFANPDSVVEELHALTGVVSPQDEPSCICYPGMCPMGCEPACPRCSAA